MSRTLTSTPCSSTWPRHLTPSTERPCGMSSLAIVAFQSSFTSFAFSMLIRLDKSFPTVSSQILSSSPTRSNRAVFVPVLFNLFFTCVLRQAVGNMDEGVYVRFCYDGSIFDLWRLNAKTKTLNSLTQEALFADDCALMAHKPGDLQAMLNSFSDTSKQFGLTINVGKTEVLF